jgi:hypothetical protein
LHDRLTPHAEARRAAFLAEPELFTLSNDASAATVLSFKNVA